MSLDSVNSAVKSRLSLSCSEKYTALFIIYCDNTSVAPQQHPQELDFFPFSPFKGVFFVAGAADTTLGVGAIPLGADGGVLTAAAASLVTSL